MTKQRMIKLVLIICFSAVLLLPLCLTDFVGGKVSNAENRMLATPPTYNGDPKAYCVGIEDWLNDNIGFRDLMRRTVTYAEYYLFQSSAKSTDLLGKNGWIYYYTRDILNDFIGSNPPSQALIQDFAFNMQTITDTLAARDCEALFVFAPDKKTIYPEFYPEGIHRVSEKTHMTLLYEALEQQGINVLNLETALTQSKKLGSLYSPRIDNAHWNTLGAFVGYQATCEKLKQLSPHMVSLADCTVTPFEAIGSFNDTVPITEVDYRIETNLFDDITPAFSDLARVPELQYNQDATTYQKRYVNTNSALPKLLYVGDSYIVRAVPFFPLSFSEVTYLHFSDIAYFWNVFDTFSPDVVVFESAERMLETYQIWLATCAQAA